eukprot:2971780-Rhodomonas_salina.1
MMCDAASHSHIPTLASAVPDMRRRIPTLGQRVAEHRMLGQYRARVRARREIPARASLYSKRIGKVCPDTALGMYPSTSHGVLH